MDLLNAEEERLFTRLIMKADDYGNFHRNPKLIKSLLFPLKDELRVSDINRWLTSLQAAGLVRTYTVGSNSFLNIVNFGQRLRQHKRSFPEPIDFDDGINLSASCQQVVSKSPPEEKRREENKNTKMKGETVWKEQFCIAKDVSPEQMDSLIDEFCQRLELTDDDKPMSEMKKHFLNWFSKKPKSKVVPKSKFSSNEW